MKAELIKRLKGLESVYGNKKIIVAHQELDNKDVYYIGDKETGERYTRAELNELELGDDVVLIIVSYAKKNEVVI